MPTPPLCRHMRVGGRSCRAIALKGQPFCYTHDTTRLDRAQVRRTALSRRPPTPELLYQLSSIDDVHVIYQAFCAVIDGLATNALGPRRAHPMLRALNVASRNAAPQALDPTQSYPGGTEAEAILRLIQGRPSRPAPEDPPAPAA